MIPIFIPWPAVASVGPQSVGAPICAGLAVEERVVADARVDARDARDARERARARGGGTTTASPFEDDAVAPADRAPGIALSIRACERALRGRERPQVRDARRRAEVEPARVVARAARRGSREARASGGAAA